MTDPMRRRARQRLGAQQLARLDDHLLRDIGLTRSQVMRPPTDCWNWASLPLQVASKRRR
jgi:hypothetical protein